ncbi:outer membrane protein assembly factor BamB family protein [Cellulomonas carbonis]|uniref:Pyrrolo-quinoline quinone repeat domain-containing protein n=1 Tax=Cellulomonas carbonis T26 TaxID=947969 RepID=A0A0A0BSR9_9CELL|nr:PQQ-binding-like beta-propeller repeat protein [Cellulomonas carbonis]KGM10697.1 hypothetical protein N868_13990 [Cellulomonas carbonis T26]GGC07835.1 hypothetical protein GCM10010972_21380 [Cellulomonas carbonis]
MARGGDGMVDVELDEPPLEGEPAAARGRPAAPAGPLGDRLRRAARRRWPVAVVAVLVLGVSARVSDAAAARDDAAVVAGFSAVPGVAPSLRVAPREVWRVEGRAQTVAGLVLTHGSTPDGVVLTARDATGDVVWTAPVPTDRASPAAGGARPDCAAADDVLVCEVTGGGVRAPNTDAVLGGPPDMLLTVRADDGTTVRVEDATDVVDVAVADADVVVARVEGGFVRVERADPRTGEVRWSTPLPQPLADGVPPETVAIDVEAGLVTVEDALGAVIDVDDGTLVGAWPRPPAGPITVDATTVGFTVWRPAVGASWFDRDGSVGAWFPGDPVRTEVSDGSAPEMVLVRVDGSLQAVDVREGFHLWTRSGVERVLLRIDGLVALEGDGAVRVVDLRTGDLLWSVGVPGDRGPDQAAVTDGVRLLVLAERDGARRLVARDLRTGSERWSTPLQPGRAGPAVDGGLLVSREGRDHVVWGG